MAQLTKPEPMSGLNIDAICPPGQYVAVCLDVLDLFGVTRRKFQSQEQETKDVTRFIFGVIAADGRPYLLQTYELTIAATPNSNLMKFLTSWVGRVPEFGWDYCEMKHTGAMIAVQTKTSNGVPPRQYSTITGIFPVPGQMMAHIPNPAMFSGLLTAATVGRDQNQGASGHYTPPAGTYANPQALMNQQPPVQQMPPQQMMPPYQAPQQMPPQQTVGYLQPGMQPMQQPAPGVADWNPAGDDDDIPF